MADHIARRCVDPAREFIGGAANALTMVIVDPLNFNLNEGVGNLLTVAATSAIVAAAMYLKQSPLPNTEGQ